MRDNFQAPAQSPPVCASYARRFRLSAGIALIAFSFLVYPGYSVFIFLPLSEEAKLGGLVAGSFLSWGIFGAGSLLAGREGCDWLKRLWKRCRLQ